AAWHERVVTEFEQAADRRLALFRTMTRIGPLLGLMGTLIPLGPALVALAAGDIAVLARKMEVAFATTVVGLVIGAIGFLLHQASQRWAMDDLSLLEWVSARLRGAS
ncbi:MAG: MotA/TolQ/ExbB proton channel family protein, partial [Burkholderiaceae bacterium]